jgi:hypothetical protein
MSLVVGLFCILFGAVLAFAGYRLFRFLLPLWGFIIGFWFSEAIIAALLGDSNTAVIIGWAAGLVGGLVLAGLSYFLFNLGVAILAASAGYWLTANALGAIGLESFWLVTILSVAVAVLLVVLALRGSIDRPLVIVLSALLGASFITLGLLFLIGDITVETFRSGVAVLDAVIDSTPFWLVFWAGAAAVGAVVQWLLTGPEPEAREAVDEGPTEDWDSQATVAADTDFWDDDDDGAWQSSDAPAGSGTTVAYTQDDDWA